MKIQVIKKATPRAGADIICPWFIDVPMRSTRRASSVAETLSGVCRRAGR